MSAETKDLLVEDMVNKYAKKWKVSPEEAALKVKQFLQKKPSEPTKDTVGSFQAPSEDDMFPVPVGPISKKVQDINQAALNSALTRKNLKELSQPPKEMETLKEKVQSFESTLNTVVEMVNTTMKTMNNELQERKTKEQFDTMIETLKTEVVGPLKERVELLEAAKQGDPAARAAIKGLTPENVFVKAKEITDEAKDWLERTGHKIEEPTTMGKQEVEAILDKREKELKAKWEEESGAQIEIEQQRITATENILTGVVDKVMEIFIGPMKEQIQKAIKEGAFQRKKV